jgi:cobalt-zinc-cadmium efflux system outer membrane protein
MIARQVGGLGVLLLLLSGCLTPPRPAVSVDVPRLDPPPSVHIDPGIQRVRHDEELLPAPKQLPAAVAGATPSHPIAPVRLTLDQAINTTLLADPKLKAAFEVIIQARADHLTASLPPNPSVTITQTLMPLFESFNVDHQGGPPQFDAGLSYPIDWCLFGKRAAAMVKATEGVRISETDFSDAIRTRINETAQAFFDVMEARALRELAQQDVETLEKNERALVKGVADGGLPKVDLNRLRLDLLNSRRTLREADGTLIAAHAKLRGLLGGTETYPPIDPVGTLEGGSLQVPQISVDEAYTVALGNRPDLQSLRSKIAQGLASMELERTKAWPDVAPQIGYTHQFQRQAIGFPDANAYGFGVVITPHIFDRNQGNRMHASSEYAQAQHALRAGEVDLRTEVETALTELRTAGANAESISSEQLKLAAEVRDSITDAYRAGGRPLIDVLDAQRAYRETARAHVSSRASYWRALWKFQTALGQQVITHDGQPSRPGSPAH